MLKVVLDILVNHVPMIGESFLDHEVISLCMYSVHMYMWICVLFMHLTLFQHELRTLTF